MWVRGLGHQVLGLGRGYQILASITATALVLFIAENVIMFSAMYVHEFVCLLIGLRFPKNPYQLVTLRAKLSVAVYCNWSCLWVCVCLWVCYHDNSKLRASIFTKLGL